jgi:hypothetical protein
MTPENIQAWARESDLPTSGIKHELQKYTTLARADLVAEVERLTEQCKLFDAAAYKARVEAQTLVDAAQAEVERERLRLAACGVAALGYFDGCKDEYRSGSLDDVLKIRAEVDSLTRDRDEWKEATELANIRFKRAEAEAESLRAACDKFSEAEMLMKRGEA